MKDYALKNFTFIPNLQGFASTSKTNVDGGKVTNTANVALPKILTNIFTKLNVQNRPGFRFMVN